MSTEIPENDPGILTCWKEIAQYLGKGVRTVQRWERDFGLPVRRPNGIDHKSAVIAYTRDLDAWLESRWCPREKEGQSNGAMNGVLEIRDMIQTSQALRKTSSDLVREMSEALKKMRTLIHSCDRLSKGDAFAFAQLGGQNGDLLSESASEIE